jgi:glycosyltransferase involved in cell wall biosynthesis
MPDHAPTEQLHDTTPTLLFVGVMNTSANIDAIRFFANSVLPLVRRSRPDVRLMVVGRDPGPGVRRLHNGTNLIVTGSVPSVEPFLRQATAVIVPIRFGGGTRIKILEAMAHGKPMVSTTVGAEGLDVKPNEHLLIADTPTGFADACVRLLGDAEMREKLSGAASQLVKEKYQWDEIELVVRQVVRPESKVISAGRSKTGYDFPAHQVGL